MKFKALLLAAVVGFSGSAHAAIQGVSGSNTDNSDLIVVIYDKVKDLSFVQDLGTRYMDVVAANGNFSGSFSLNASALSVFATSNLSDLNWSMASGNFAPIIGPEDENGDVTTDSHLVGFVTTSVGTPVPLSSTPQNQTNGKLRFFGFDLNVGSAIGTGANAVGLGAGTITTDAKNWNNLVQNNSIQNSAKVSTALNLWWDHLDVAGTTPSSNLASQNAWVLDLSNLSSATLSSTPANVGQVPLPAAAWLMISALFGLGGIARRRNAKV